MYVGRIVSVGMTKSGKVAAMYRVSSRSFPNREAAISDAKISIVPKAGFESDLSKNPYIAYNCLRLTGDFAIATNGSQTDPVTEKIASGMNPRDALAISMLAMDYEKDDYDTPRISAVVNRMTSSAYLAIVRRDALHVAEFALTPGMAYYVATYEHNTPSKHYFDDSFDASTAFEACAYVMGKGVFAELEKPITAAVAMATDATFELATTN
ncbi:MAG: IMP cyclohydrolase [Kiritimatiellaeota bacterium]|nr:IMP cyclohydrolase [Kiritimatiellota bacterium]